MARGAKGDFGRASPELLEGLKVGQLRAMYTIKGMEEKYSRFEEREAKYDVEIDPLTGEVFYPESLTQREVKNQIRKTSKLAKEFSLAKITAPYNGVEVFGKEYRNRMKACKRLDEEFVQELRTNHPKEYSSSLKKWQPYEPRRRPNTKRTIVRETVKELTFENPMDYLNYIMKRKNIPSNLFERQGRLECSTYMALEPAEMRDDESTFGGTAICDGNSSESSLMVSRWLQNSSIQSTVSDAVPLLMVAYGDCSVSRACSPVCGSPTVSNSKGIPDCYIPSSEQVSSGLQECRGLRSSEEIGKNGVLSTENHLVSPLSSLGNEENDCRHQELSPFASGKTSKSFEVSEHTESSAERVETTVSCKAASLQNRTPVTCSDSRPSRECISAGKRIRRLQENAALKHRFSPSIVLNVSKNTTNSPVSATPTDIHETTSEAPSSQKTTPVATRDIKLNSMSKTPVTRMKASEEGQLLSTLSNDLAAPCSVMKKSTSKRRATPVSGTITSSASGTRKYSLRKRLISKEIPVVQSTIDTPLRSRTRSAMRTKNGAAQGWAQASRSASCKLTSSSLTSSRGSGKVPSASLLRNLAKVVSGKRTSISTHSASQINDRGETKPSVSSTSSSSARTNAAQSRCLTLKGSRTTRKTHRTTLKGTASRDATTPAAVLSVATPKRRLNGPPKSARKNTSMLKRTSSQPAKNRVDSNNSSPCNPEERSSSRMATAGSSPRSRKRRHSGGETAESPTITLTFSAGLWNEKLLEIAKSYEDAGIKGKKTILGFDVHEFRNGCESEQSTLSCFAISARKHQSSCGEVNMVDSGMKEDRRAMAAAKSRNRTLKSGYFV